MPPETEPSLHERLEEVFDENAGTGEGSGSSKEDVSPLPGDGGDGQEGKGGEEQTLVESAADGEQSGGDESPRETIVEETEKQEGGEQKEVKVEETSLKPPSSWKPAMREKFSALPADVQGEIMRREVDMTRGMELVAEARRFKQDFDNKVAPYQAELASRGVGAMDAFDNYLSTAYKLRHAPPQEKAALVAGLIGQYAIDIEMLDTVLTNQQNAGPGNGAAPQGNSGVAYEIQKAMAPYQQFMDGVQQNQIRSVEQTQHEIRGEITVFANDAKNEFYDDVKLEMATFLEAAAQRNQNMTLQDAYDRAILLRPDLAELVAQRKLQSEADSRNSAAAAAKAKAVGVQGSSPDSGAGRAQPASLRGAIEAAMDSNN